VPASYAGLLASGAVFGTNSVLTMDTIRDTIDGEHVFVGTSNNGGSVNVTSVTVDGQSLTKVMNGPDNFTHIELWSGRLSGATVTGADVVITLPASVSVSIVGIASSAFGISPTSPLDRTATNFGTSINPVSGTTAETTQRDEFAVTVAKPFGLPGISADAPYTEVTEVNDTGATAVLTMSYRVLTLAATQQASWTLAGSQSYDALIATFKALPTPPEVSYTRFPKFLLAGRRTL